ncbi:MAG: peptidoglycan DD-metalloendopeptidase family protein [Candidatus Cloacimonetes bacterium]|nr:peptidoglycan DD-metalloendopeptidase family protein [Candidatus Cloacimonadota bacterium]
MFLFVWACAKKVDDTEARKEKEQYVEKEIRIPEGSSLYGELAKIGLTEPFLTDLSNALGNEVDVAHIQPNSLFKAYFDPKSDEFKKLEYVESAISSHFIYVSQGEISYEHIVLETEKRMRLIEGYLDVTLSHSLAQKGIGLLVRNEIGNALESKINFEWQAQKGDHYKALIEEQYYQNERMPITKVLYVHYNGKSAGTVSGYRYEEENIESSYNGLYLEDGTAMLTASMRTPLDVIRITSRFGYRIHPISRQRRLHSGVDYRAPRGTSVYAIAKGTVVRASWNGGFGNTVEIRHPDGIISQYAHLDRILVKHGQSVRAGTIVGRVGSTGYSTGPHLHFGIRKNNQWVNPLNYKMLATEKLTKERLQIFKKQIVEIKKRLENMQIEEGDPFDLTPVERYRREHSVKY